MLGRATFGVARACFAGLYEAPIGAHCLEHKAALAGRFGKEQPLNYAYHLDAGLYAQFLRRIA